MPVVSLTCANIVICASIAYVGIAAPLMLAGFIQQLLKLHVAFMFCHIVHQIQLGYTKRKLAVNASSAIIMFGIISYNYVNEYSV